MLKCNLSDICIYIVFKSSVQFCAHVLMNATGYMSLLVYECMRITIVTTTWDVCVCVYVDQKIKKKQKVALHGGSV